VNKNEFNLVKYAKKDGTLGFFMFLAYIGAAIYFIQQTNGGFWQVILGLLKAAVWPVYLILHTLTALGA
jgi:hypothetical protein